MVRSKLLVVFSFSIISLFVFGCTSPQKFVQKDDQSRKVANTPGVFCSVEHVTKDTNGRSVTVCDELYQERPYLHLTATEVAKKIITVIGALEENSDEGLNLVSIDNVYTLISKNQKPLQKLPIIGEVGFERHYTLYKVVGEISSKDPLKIIPKSASPVLVVSACAFDGLFAATWTAKITARTGPNSFSKGKLVPFHMTFQRMDAGRSFFDLKKSNLNTGEMTDLPDGKVNNLIGQIDNMYSDFTDSNGQLYPNLSALGDENPFLGSKSNEVSLSRLGAMHSMGPSDYHLVMVWPKGSQGLSPVAMNEGPEVMSLKNLIRGQNDRSLTFTKMMPHGLAPGFAITDLQAGSVGDYRMSCPSR